MIKQVTNLNQISEILKTHFRGYKISDDPFEKVAIYTDRDIMGIISYSIIYERGEINYIITLPNYRNKGIGQKLLEYAISDMGKSGCKTISLEVETENIAGINLYKKYNFQTKTIRPNYYGGKDAYLMVKEIEVKKWVHIF